MIEEVAKRVEGIQFFYPTDQVVAAMKGIIKSPFAPWIEKVERPRDFNSLVMERYEGRGDLMVHMLHFKQRMSMEKVSEALTCKLFTTTLTGKALSWFNQLLEGSIESFTTFGRKLLEQYHNNHP